MNSIFVLISWRFERSSLLVTPGRLTNVSLFVSIYGCMYYRVVPLAVRWFLPLHARLDLPFCSQAYVRRPTSFLSARTRVSPGVCACIHDAGYLSIACHRLRTIGCELPQRGTIIRWLASHAMVVWRGLRYGRGETPKLIGHAYGCSRASLRCSQRRILSRFEPTSTHMTSRKCKIRI
jgi:hypothetical protein